MPVTGAIYENLKARFKGIFRHVESEHTVGTTPAKILGHDVERVSILFSNLGTSTIIIAPSPAVSTTRGIRIGPQGGKVSIDVYEDSILPALEWHALSDAAGGALYVLYTKRDVAVDENGG